MGARHFGARVPRLEDPALLTGRGRFVDDIRLAGALHACFVRSPYAHAKVRAIDASAARAMPGVHAVLTADDLPVRMARSQIPMLVPNPSIATPRTQLALARREVCYVGQTIAVAIADNRFSRRTPPRRSTWTTRFCPRSATAAGRRRPMRRLHIAISRPMSPPSLP